MVHSASLLGPGPRGNGHLSWAGLPGTGASLALAEKLGTQAGSTLTICASASAADRIVRELQFFAPALPVQRFSDYETLPYEPISPPQELISERLGLLSRLAEGQYLHVVTTCDALLGRLPPPRFVSSHTLSLDRGQDLAREATVRRLADHGYLRVERVTEPGEFAVRGAVMDIFPSGAAAPIRVDFFDDEIEKLRTFDPGTQLSTGEVNAVRILPGREFPLDSDAIRGFRERFRTAFAVEPGRCSIYRDISEAVLPAGIEYYLPLFFDATSTLFDYLGPETLIFSVHDAIEALQDSWTLITQRHEQSAGDIERPLLPPEQAFINPVTVLACLDRHPLIHLRAHRLEATAGENAVNAQLAQPLLRALPDQETGAAAWLDTTDRVLIVTSSRGRREVIVQLLRARGAAVSAVGSWADFLASDVTVGVALGELGANLRLPAQALSVFSAETLGLEKPRQRIRRRRPARDPDAIVRELTDLQVGAPVVHEDYGVGRYRGLITLAVDDRPIEFLLLEYADEDKLYVPVHSLHLVSRYTGAAPENAPLHRLGSDQWANARRKAAQQARDIAAELLNIYAQRAARGGTPMPSEQAAYEQFAAEFPFEETDDQQSAVRQVLEDLAAPRSMDRIICGDVGFGKTEVALRSAFVAANAGQQVAVLVPTTLLAQQHYRTFSDRFANWPIRVSLLSRFNSTRQTTEILDGLSTGSIDVVIGTHKLLQRGVNFARLGLVIIDEEHRFGVKDKERLKRMRADVDLLTLTATPIPRTLNMSLGGLRDLSIIATPPTDRLAVKTFVGEWRDGQIREAILREIRRGGQVFFVHNRVEDIEQMEARVRKIAPEAGVRFAHGQMPESMLESVMIDFYHRRFNVLVCTTIVESGIDIPTANTIIINRADRFGLAQLHQLRGRVGRSHHQAYAYLLTPDPRALTADARKRLEAIESLDELGAGFTLATHDLEIRGAGELLGAGQSGQISAVGFTLYNELLQRAVAALRRGQEPDLDDPFEHGPQVEVGLAALIPEDYMPDVHMRLVHYKRIANADSESRLRDLQVELIDRFGLLPEPTRALFAVTGLKLLAQTIGITRIQAGADGGSLEFSPKAAVDAEKLVALVTGQPGLYRLDGPCKLRFSLEQAQENRIGQIARLLTTLGATLPAAGEAA